MGLLDAQSVYRGYRTWRTAASRHVFFCDGVLLLADCRCCGSSPAAVECVANIAIPFVIAAVRGLLPVMAQLQGTDVGASVTFTGAK
jgi:hypothetical protein